jgi:putative FmdB family regulatory protein
MPIYEYRCEACGHELDELQKLADAPLTDCPRCGKRALTRLVSAAGFQLKGTGWYATDFSGKKKGERGKDEGSAAPAEPPKADAAPAAKPEPKAETKAETKAAPKPDAATG